MADKTYTNGSDGASFGVYQRADTTYAEVAVSRRHVDTVLSQSGTQAGFTSADLAVGDYDELAIDLNFTGFTGGTSPSLALVVKRKGADNVYYQIANPTALTAAGTVILHVGKGCATNVLFGDIIQVLVTVTGSPTAAPWTLSVKGK